MRSSTDVIELVHGSMSCAIAPHLGGALLRLRLGDRDLLRAAPYAARDVLAAASFPLVPFANRIAEGRLVDGERVVELPADPAARPHAHHGHGWRASWNVVDADADTATLAFEHPAGTWPWPYRASQRFALSADELSITLSVLNRAPSAMPVGVGIHPYFQRSDDSRVTANAGAWWVNDAQGVARMQENDATFAGGRTNDVSALEGIDNFYVSPDPQVIIEGGGSRIVLSGPGAGFHLYVPAAERVFCVEPVTHAPNSFGRGDYAVGDRLSAGEERHWTFRLTATEVDRQVQ